MLSMARFPQIRVKKTYDYRAFLPTAWRPVVVGGYFLAVLWLGVSLYIVGWTLKSPLPLAHEKPSATPSVLTLAQGLLPADEAAASRDPFARVAPLIPKSVPEAASRPVDPSGFEVKGIILANKKGAVLENSRGGELISLSEGERSGDLLLKRVGKDAVVIEVNGAERIIDITVNRGVK